MKARRFAVAVASLGWIAAATPASAGFDGVLIGPTLFSYNFDNDHLVCFSAFTPGMLMRDIPLTGLFADEFLMGLDFRPATGELYAIGTRPSGDRVVTIDVDTGAVTAVSPSPFTNVAGGQFGLDFNPVVDRIRLVSNLESNLRFNPETGAMFIDSALAYAGGDPGESQNPNVVHVAYTNSFAGATMTTLFGIDVARDVLVRIGSVGGTPMSPNGGQLTTIGPLGVDAAGSGGFDIDPETGTAWAALQVGSSSGLYGINLTTGAATLVGAIGSGGDFDALAVPEAAALAAGLCAAIALAWMRRKRP